ncbi:hypothetical protein G9A89_015986 [Geosiphon pyriformis]|nr:hypothetical protein G9A89_015986 [Geosiphon pyriformis]
MDLEAAFSSDMSKKKAPKGAFHGSAGGSFLQKKKVVLGNVKHSGDEKNISLSRSELSNNMFSNIDSLSGNEEDANITGINVGFLLGLTANTSKAKCVNTDAVFGSLLSFPNFDINDDEKSMEMATLLARKKEFNVNNDLKKQEIHSDWTVVIKEISMNMPKKMIVTTVSVFGEIRNYFKALLFTLPVKTTAHDLGTLLKGTGGKTCIINHSLNSEDLESAYHTESIFGGIKLFWAKLDLVCCGNCKCFGHSAMECDIPTAPDAKFSSFGSGSGFPFLGVVCNKENTLDSHDSFSINNHLASLEHSLELLADQVSDVLCRLNGVKLVFLVPVSKVGHLDVPILVSLMSDADMRVAICNTRSMTNLAKQDDIVHWHRDLGNMISIVIETKLRSDIKSWIMDKFDGVWVFTTGLDVGFQDADIAIIMNTSLA